MTSTGGYDRSEPNGFRVNLYIILTSLLLIGIFVLSTFMYKTFISIEQDHFLETKTRSWATTYRQQQQDELKSYKWSNKSKGLVQVPISDAIDRLAQ